MNVIIGRKNGPAKIEPAGLVPPPMKDCKIESIEPEQSIESIESESTESGSIVSDTGLP